MQQLIIYVVVNRCACVRLFDFYYEMNTVRRELLTFYEHL